jgi:hypothetical protein
LTRLKKHIQKSLVVSYIETSSKLGNQKLKSPVFKPYQVTKTSQTQLQNNKKDFLKATKDHLNHLKASSFTLIAYDIPQISNHLPTCTSYINTILNNQIQTSDEEAF